jgi:ApeA N-terminal domain 1
LDAEFPLGRTNASNSGQGFTFTSRYDEVWSYIFVTLIWGIEAFHRTKHPDSSSDKIKTKVCRVIEQVSQASDKRWLKGVLKHAHEPSLEQRIFDVLTAIPINIDNTKTREFAHECAERRHEMSHFGAQKHGRNYTDFIRDLEKKSAALSILYHTLILHEIGIDEKIFKRWIYEGFRSYPIKRTLVEVGLLDKSVLEPRDIASRPVAGGHS